MFESVDGWRNFWRSLSCMTGLIRFLKSLIRIFESNVHVSWMRPALLSCLASYAIWALLFVKSSARYTEYRDPSAASKGLSFKFFLHFMTRALVRLLANFTMIDRGGVVGRTGGGRDCSLLSSSGSGASGGSLTWGLGGGLPKRWATSMSSRTLLNNFRHWRIFILYLPVLHCSF